MAHEIALLCSYSTVMDNHNARLTRVRHYQNFAKQKTACSPAKTKTKPARKAPYAASGWSELPSPCDGPTTANSCPGTLKSYEWFRVTNTAIGGAQLVGPTSARKGRSRPAVFLDLRRTNARVAIGLFGQESAGLLLSSREHTRMHQGSMRFPRQPVCACRRGN